MQKLLKLIVTGSCPTTMH